MKSKKPGYDRYAKYGYLFSIPFVIAFLLFSLYPTVYTAVIGFTDLKGLGKTDIHFLTDDLFRNFKTVLSSPSFQLAFRNTVVIWLANFIPQMLLALLLAAWFRVRLKYCSICRISLRRRQSLSCSADFSGIRWGRSTICSCGSDSSMRL